MSKSDGTTKKISRRRNQCNVTNKPRPVGAIPETSRGIRTIKIGVSRENSVGTNTSGGYDYDGGTPIGKIFQRLELVERSYKDYVRAHQTRLKARLDESENLEKLFCESVEELRQEIYQLATEANKSNGNGHKS